MENISVFIAKHMGLFYALASLLIALTVVEVLRAKRGRLRLRPTDAVLLINKKNAVVIDIRNTDAFAKGHIIDSLSLQTGDISQAGKRLDKYKSKPLLVVCSNGIDSQKAAATLATQGFNAFVLAGGIRAWTGADLPLVKE
ncbi:MAG TPA: rhodanese-like domain-containing protein [Gammaproteobacteria bacterium]|jgi:rhodanese-related sulfurtransferase|nr:rhodanese-like domain-containing protein [Gammaproteobacteria bacterium]